MYPRCDRGDAGGISGTLHADIAQDAGRSYSARAFADLRLSAAHQRAGCGADQRHRVACARFRRFQRHHGRPSFGAAGRNVAGACRGTRRNRPGYRGRLRDRRRSRNQARACRQLPPLRQGLASDRDAWRVRRRSGRLPPDEARLFKDHDGAVYRGIARERPEGEFRHHDQTASYRPVLPQRPAGGAAGRGRLRCRHRCLRARAGLFERLQRSRHVRRRKAVRELGPAVGDRGQVDRAQAVSLLRQYPSRHQHGAEFTPRGKGRRC